ncbi:MAG: hypothetical protein ACFFDN_12030 [Candidatus Hodarchaeota archaeon]
MEVIKIGKDKILYQGELSGTIELIGGSGVFSSSGTVKVKLSEPIMDIKEVIAKSRHFNEFPFEEGDSVKINGKIIRKFIAFWGKEYDLLSAEHVWNETKGFGW